MHVSNPCYVYSITIFNTIDAYKDIFKFFTKIAKKFVFQLEECPTTKSHHFQCYVNLKIKKRQHELCKMLNSEGFNGAHCAIASDTGKERLKMYSMKEDTRIDGPWADHPIYLGRDLIKKLRPWQQNIVNMLDEKPHDRRIWWYYDKQGGKGKSSLAKFMYYHHKIITLKVAKASDIINLVFKLPAQKMYIFDVQRTTRKDLMLDMYSAIEEVKTGYVVNTKYETGVKLFDRPHIIVFSNYMPDKSRLSSDMIEVIDLCQMCQKK